MFLCLGAVIFIKRISARFQVFTAASKEMTVFWAAAPCSLVDIDRLFRDAYYLHHHPDEGHSKFL
jgi:hypothetical protein